MVEGLEYLFLTDLPHKNSARYLALGLMTSTIAGVVAMAGPQSDGTARLIGAIAFGLCVAAFYAIGMLQMPDCEGVAGGVVSRHRRDVAGVEQAVRQEGAYALRVQRLEPRVLQAGGRDDEPVHLFGAQGLDLCALTHCA